MPIQKAGAVLLSPGIRQLGPGRFHVEVWATDPKTGKRQKRQALVSTVREAHERQEELRAGPAVRASKVRLRDYAGDWLERRQASFSPSTQERLVYELARINVGLGDLYLDAIEPVDLSRWRDSLTADYRPATINSVLRTLRSVLDQAREDRLIRFNPAREVKGVREGRTQGARGRVLSPSEFRRFVDSARQLADNGVISPDVGRLVLLLAWTGLRLGEAIALRWSDYRDGELHVGASAWGGEVKGTKTDDPRRVVVVAPLAQVLADQRAWLDETGHQGRDSGLMFPASAPQAHGGAARRGGQVRWFRNDRTLARPLAQISKAAGVDRLTAHSFRRTWEGLLRQAGVDGMVRRSLAGWRAEGAQAIYAVVGKEEQARAGAAVVGLVGLQPQPATPALRQIG